MFEKRVEKHFDIQHFYNVKSHSEHAIYARCLLKSNMKSDRVVKHACKNTSKFIHLIQWELMGNGLFLLLYICLTVDWL